jgi:outer membrane protein OmpA-like peptidoglycan-associated protein/tetratricopeptide (TPR) repeat protein
MKTTFRYLVATLSIIILLTNCSVQNRVKTANKAYSNYLYNDAIDGYESINKKKRDNNTLSRLADSYRLAGNSKKAEIYYEQLTQKGGATHIDVLHYAEVLKMNGKYEEALVKMEQYNQAVNGEDRINQHISNKTYYVPLLEDNGQFALKNLKINTTESDFGTSYFQDKVVFVTSRKGLGFTNYEYNWNVKNFLNLYSFEKHPSDKTKVKKIKSVKIKGGLNKKFHEGPATFSADGSLMIFTRDRYTKSKELNTEGVRVLELWYSEKNAKGKWGKAQPMSFNNKDYNVGHGALSADGKTLYFVSDMPGGFGGSDIYISKRNADNSWGTPVNAGKKINTEGKEMFPFYHEKRILFFASDGHAGLGGLDVFMATANGETFGTAKNLGSPLNGPKDDFAFILDNEMMTGFVSSNREGGKGNDDIYSFDLLKPFKLTKKIEGIAREKGKGTILPGSIIKLYSADKNVVAETIADENGYYAFDVEPDQDFILSGDLEKYNQGNNTASTKTDKEVIQADLDLERIPQIGLVCFVSDAKAGTPIEDAHLVFTDKLTGKVFADVYTDKEGYWKKALEEMHIGDKLSYEIAVSKEGYLEKTLTFYYAITKEGEIKVHEKLDLTLGKIEVGTDIGKLIDIKPIYFDLGKYKIRPDAAKELDKIVEVMNKYPSIVIELGSHTDCRGSYASNEKLSDNRAKSSAAYIVSKGISADRIYGRGYGEKELLNDCKCEGAVKSTCSEEEHQMNRRTVFKIVKMNEQGVGHQ